MNRAYKEARKALLQRYRHLVRLYRRTSNDEQQIIESDTSDWPDRASETVAGRVLEQVSESERKELFEIQAALARLDSGEYDKCELCHAPINPRRLRALPETRRCLDCAERDGAAA